MIKLFILYFKSSIRDTSAFVQTFSDSFRIVVSEFLYLLTIRICIVLYYGLICQYHINTINNMHNNTYYLYNKYLLLKYT